ncbi:MAG: hypothetical protein ACREJC_17970, partial [Tepidisphaeraceae bacterium]
SNVWLKIKIWTKSVVIGALVVYALLFILNNSGQSVKFWYWFRHEYETSMLVLVLLTFAAGIVGTLLVRTVLTTMRQIRESRARTKTVRMERDLAEMKSKAAMLQTRAAPSTPAVPSSPASPDEFAD